LDSQHALNAKTGKWGDASPVKEIIAQISGLVKTLDYSSLTIFPLFYCRIIPKQVNLYNKSRISPIQRFPAF